MYVISEIPQPSSQQRLGPGLIAILANASIVALLSLGISVAPKSKPQPKPSDVVIVREKPKESPVVPLPDDNRIVVETVDVPVPPMPENFRIQSEEVTNSLSNTVVSSGMGGAGSVVEPEFVQARIVKHSEPPYPTGSIRASEEGTVMLNVFVGSDGRVSDVRVATSSGYQRLDSAAMKEVRTWRFAPATRGGQAISAWVNVPVKFELH